jgi:nickel transport protein
MDFFRPTRIIPAVSPSGAPLQERLLMFTSVPARLLAGCAAVVGLSIAFAHEYVIEREGETYLLYQGHLYSAHAGEERVIYDPAIVKQAYCVRTSGELVQAPTSTGYPFRLKGPCSGVLIQTSSGYWSQTLTGTKNIPKTDTSGVLRSWLSEESIKLIDAWVPALAAPLARGLELVPLSDPHAVAAGDKLRVQAMWQGQPKAGVTVAYQGNPRGVAGEDGIVNIRLRQSGIQVISASFEEPLNDPKADKIVRATVLQFKTR